MGLFKFMERYRNFNKVINELKLLEKYSVLDCLKHERAAVNNKGNVSAYERKKLQYSRGQKDAYTKAIKLITEYMKTGVIEGKDGIDIKIDA